jgi:hypothetical protein
MIRGDNSDKVITMWNLLDLGTSCGKELFYKLEHYLHKCNKELSLPEAQVQEELYMQ